MESVSIPSNAPFLRAIEQYADDNKPDPLSLKQLKGLSVEWENRTLPPVQQSFTFDPTHLIHGILSITGEYILVRLSIICAWTFDESSPKHGNLSYKCGASAEMVESKKMTDGFNEKAAVDEKIKSKMQKRLKKDAYISKLLTNSKGDRTESDWPVFASAEIRSLMDDLEERVDVSQPIAEAIKRAVWSSAESTLDIVDLLLQFPCLPTSMHTDIIATTELANRAKLRLLEDAMVDACEQEGEDQILEDLTIGGEKKAEEEDATESRGKNQSKRSKR
ncbi:unnamed protein product [Cylindrotheca closterium]|uniref:Uncharacterized protein n=1 Tax=Cylindrotheca closterium TaxID=2856 RepID=A0AAD2FSV1_9STRA|nr:unnamed protein product [Cylindrotheca closterium]